MNNEVVFDEVQFDQNELDIRDELDISDMLYWFDHRALGLTKKEACEIDKLYDYPDFE